MVNVPTSVQVFGRKKTATAVALCKRGQGLIKVNGRPLDLVQPETLRMKVQEPLLIIGKERFAGIDIRISVKGGGQIAQIYAVRQALSKAIVAYYQKFVDEASKKEIKDTLVQYDHSLLVADLRRSCKGVYPPPYVSVCPSLICFDRCLVWSFPTGSFCWFVVLSRR